MFLCCLYSNTFLCWCQWFCTHSCVENHSCLSVSKSAQFRTRCPPSRSPGVACLVSSADRCSVSSVRACVPCLAWSVLHLARPALLPVLCSLSGCAGVCRGTPAGHTAAAQPCPVSLSTTEKIKKAQKLAAQFCATKNFLRKNKKTPTKGLCSVLYLPYKP